MSSICHSITFFFISLSLPRTIDRKSENSRVLLLSLQQDSDRTKPEEQVRVSAGGVQLSRLMQTTVSWFPPDRCLCGFTVNHAARMSCSGKVGVIQKFERVTYVTSEDLYRNADNCKSTDFTSII